ncbi:MAG: hypothetical protein AAFN94_00730 [Pseudomonadota bacterium]
MSIDPNIVLSWEKRIKDAGLNATSVSSQIASRSMLPNLFRTARVTPNKIPVPSVMLVMKLGEILGATLEEMMQTDARLDVRVDPKYQAALGAQAQKVIDDLGREISRRQALQYGRPLVEDVLNWWRENNGRLEACGQIQEAFDLIEPPGRHDTKITAKRIGGMSLAAKHLGTDTARLSRLLDLLPPEEKNAMVVSYRSASRTNKPTFSDPIKMSVRSRGDQISLDEEYIRMQLPVVAPDKTKLIVSYCF